MHITALQLEQVEVVPPSLRTSLHIDRHHHSYVDRQRVNEPLHVSFCLLNEEAETSVVNDERDEGELETRELF